MKTYKISNLHQADGMCDYKGLNINKFIAGSQVYDLSNNLCLIKTTEESIIQNADITILADQEYNTLKSEIDKNKANQSASINDRISALEVAMAQQLGK